MEFKGTKGQAKANGLSVIVNNKVVCQAHLMTFLYDKKGRRIEDIEGYENAKNFADAINVRQQISFSLTELLEQHNELIELCKLRPQFESPQNQHDMAINLLITKIESNGI